MNDLGQSIQVLAVKDETSERPIPTAWRQPIREIVDAFASGDFGLDREIAGVAPVSTETASHIRRYLRDHGATLVALPVATWRSSVCIWHGEHWEALVDLWTREEGHSDLVLHLRVTETMPGFQIEIYLVHVP